MRVGHGLEHEKVDNVNVKQEELLKEAELIPKVNDNLDDYTIVEQHEKGAFNVFWIHLIALFRKRIQISRKNLKGFIIEILVPVLLILIGFSFSKV